MSDQPLWRQITGVAPDAEEDVVHNTYFDDLEVALVRSGDEWFAFEDLCSHADCSLSDFGEVKDRRLICNCHGSAFDLKSGAPLNPPAETPLTTYTVKVADGGLHILIAEGGDDV
jgi:3-phenylpropionate/trans-cinnamate dioxygenase ferredoxin subunit